MLSSRLEGLVLMHSHHVSCILMLITLPSYHNPRLLLILSATYNISLFKTGILPMGSAHVNVNMGV